MKFTQLLIESIERDIIDKFNSIADDFLLDEIPRDFEVFTRLASGVSGKHDSLCYSNALEAYKAEGLPLYVGHQLGSDVVERLMSDDPKFINTSHHAWNLKNGKVYDCTLGSHIGDVYIGKRVPDRIANNLNDGSDVRDILFKYLGK